MQKTTILWTEIFMSILEIFWAPRFAPYHNAILHHLNRVILLKDVLRRMCNLDPKKERKMCDAIWNSLSCWNSKEKCLQKKKNMKSHLTVLKHLVEHSSKCGAQWTLHCCGCVCVCVFLSEGLRGRREREREAEPTNKRNCTSKTCNMGLND